MQLSLLLLIALRYSFGDAANTALGAQVVSRDADLLDSYDFVIVGGGTSGLTVADRLTENPESMRPS